MSEDKGWRISKRHPFGRAPEVQLAVHGVGIDSDLIGQSWPVIVTMPELVVDYLVSLEAQMEQLQESEAYYRREWELACERLESDKGQVEQLQAELAEQRQGARKLFADFEASQTANSALRAALAKISRLTVDGFVRDIARAALESSTQAESR